MDAEPHPLPTPAPTAAGPYDVRISDPGEIAAGLPHLLGFRPRESVVLVALGGVSGNRVGLTARVDIPPPGARLPLARALVDRMVTDDPAGVLVAVISEDGDVPGPGGDSVQDRDLPHRDLVHALVLALDEAGLAARDALLVRSGRWWSYDCPNSCCVPGAGTPLPDAVSELAAASVLAGQVIADDRADLVARIAPDPRRSAAMEEAVERVGLAWADTIIVRGRDTVAAESWQAVQDAVARLRSPSAPPLADDEVARLLWALYDREVRDRALGLALGPDAAAAEQLWTECTRRTDCPLVAGPATLLAACAWLRGDGAMAGIALDRALEALPGYQFAELLQRGLGACLPPAAIRALVAGTVEALGEAGAA